MKGIRAPTLAEYAHVPARVGRPAAGREEGRVQDVSVLPLVSVVTVVRNARPDIEKTLCSVLRQSYANIEYIVVDGASSDGTVDLIRQYESRLACWLSEPDAGISDAFNKGIALARGEIIGLLNAGDRYHEDAVRIAVDNFRRHPEIGFSFGDCVYLEEGRPCFLMRGDPDYARCIASRMPALNHPTVFVKKSVYEQYGLYSRGYRIAMDYDFFLRCHQRGVTGRSVGAVVAYMDYAGISRRQFRRALAECRRISVAHGRGRLSAWWTYGVLSVKTILRERLERMGLAPVIGWVKRRINPHYRALDGASGRKD